MSLSYDPLGRLRQTVAGTNTVQFLYEGDRLIAEYNGTGAILRRYAHGPGIDEPLVWYEGSGLTNRRWLHTDERGSIIAESNGSGAATIYGYGPYGEPRNDVWTGSRFRYTGQIVLPEAGLYHYKARVYDPIDGRFLQTDPIGYEDDLNLYAYVGNDPINSTDPLGLADYDCTIPGQGNCNLTAELRAGDTIKHGGNTYTISAVVASRVTFSIDTPTSSGVERTLDVSLARGTDHSPEGAAGLVSQFSAAIGGAAAGIEHGSGNTRVGTNGRLYYQNALTGGVFYGNQYVQTYSLARLGRMAGAGAAVVGIGADTVRTMQGDMGQGELAVRYGVAAIGLFGGPGGAAFAVTYFGGDAAMSAISSDVVRGVPPLPPMALDVIGR